MTPEITRFLQAVRPSGQGYVFTLNGKQPGQSVFASNKDALNGIMQSIAQNSDVFVSLGQFKEGSAKRENQFAEKFASCWVDLDCGNGKPYATQSDALAALQEFIQTTGIPKPSMLVNSGGGIHAYWCFTQMIGFAEWQPCAKAFKAACLAAGLEIDKTVTADAARVMRVPGSQNMKLTGNPRPVFIIEPNDDSEIKLCDFDEFFDVVKRRLESLPTPAQGPKSGSATQQKQFLAIPGTQPTKAAGLSPVHLALLCEPETPRAIANVREMLTFIDAECPYPKYRDIVWAVTSTRWSCVYELVRDWSRTAPDRFDEGVLQTIFESFSYAGGIHYGTLIHHARAGGWHG